jgi:hypothetical protein
MTHISSELINQTNRELTRASKNDAEEAVEGDLVWRERYTQGTRAVGLDDSRDRGRFIYSDMGRQRWKKTSGIAENSGGPRLSGRSLRDDWSRGGTRREQRLVLALNLTWVELAVGTRIKFLVAVGRAATRAALIAGRTGRGGTAVVIAEPRLGDNSGGAATRALRPTQGLAELEERLDEFDFVAWPSYVF